MKSKMVLLVFIIGTGISILSYKSTELKSINAQAKSIDEVDAIRLANEIAIKLGYEIRTMTVDVKKFSTESNSCLPEERRDEYAMDRKARLKDKEYFVVQFAPRELQLGGTLCVFVNTENGEILTTYQGR